MKFKLLIIYITSVLLSSCSSQFVVDHKQNEIIRVITKSDSTTNSIIISSLGIDSVMNEVLCISNMEMTKGKPESLLGNFVSDLCLKQFSNASRYLYYEHGRIKEYSS